MLCRARLLMFPALLLPCVAAQQSSAPYTLRIPVDEIFLTFHASDANGKPLTHLTRSDLSLFDNSKAQNRIVMLQSFEDLPIRAGFIFDTSASMLGSVAYNSFIIHTYAARLLRKGYDRAFVTEFDTDVTVTEDWTDSDAAIAKGAARVGDRSSRYDPLTALFDSLYKTCRDQWKPDADAPTGNFILLFSDGEDDASHVYLSEAVDMCQRTRTAIYAIVWGHRSGFSEGQKTLQALAEQTGGRLFINPREDEILKDLELMEADQRNQYRLVYKPSNFKADNSFHKIRLECSVQGSRIATRSGYYAFARR